MPVVDTQVHYGDPLPYESFFDVFFDIELDTDQNPGTGAPSQISDISQFEFPPTGLGVELFIHCELHAFPNGPPGSTDSSCHTYDANGNHVDLTVDFFPLRDQDGLDPNRLVMLINKAELIAAGGDGPYNSALLSQFIGGGGFGGGPSAVGISIFGGTLDVVPAAPPSAAPRCCRP